MIIVRVEAFSKLNRVARLRVLERPVVARHVYELSQNLVQPVVELEALVLQVGNVLNRHHRDVRLSGLEQCGALRRLTRLPELHERKVRVIVPVVNARSRFDKLVRTPLLHIERTRAVRRSQNIVADLIVERLRHDADGVTAHAADAGASAVKPVRDVVAEGALQRVLVRCFPELEPVARLTRV